MKSIIAISLSLPLLVTSLSRSQGVMLGIGGGGARIEGPRMYTTSIFLDGQGFVYEYSVGGKIMVSFPASSFSLVGIGSYHFMKAAGTATPGLYRNLSGNAASSAHFVNISLGGQWSILEGPIAPYIGVNLSASSFSKILLTAMSSSPPLRIEYGGGNGYGLGLSLGVQIRLFAEVDCDLNASQNLYGFFNGINSTSSSLNAIGINAGFLVSIN